MKKTDFDSQLKTKRKLVNSVLTELLEKPHLVSKAMLPSVKYTLQTPGKRIRAALVLCCTELIAGQTNRNAEIAAVSIELVHTYSLIHDDLPAMDNDDMRRGQPTCHKAFNEATAILAGDALLTLAFELLATQVDAPTTAVSLIAQLAQAAGPAGMIAGQMADLQAEQIQGSKDHLEYIHTNKTAKMFAAAAAMGAIAGCANDCQIKSLSEYGLKIGLGFQIADDILDVSATSEQLGKTAGKDAKAGKMTYPALLGLEQSKEIEKQLSSEALKALEPFGSEADILRQLAGALLERTR